MTRLYCEETWRYVERGYIEVRLPKGSHILVEVGQEVSVGDTLSKSVLINESLSCRWKEGQRVVIQEGTAVHRGQPLAVSVGFGRLFGRSLQAPISGLVTEILLEERTLTISHEGVEVSVNVPFSGKVESLAERTAILFSCDYLSLKAKLSTLGDAYGKLLVWKGGPHWEEEDWGGAILLSEGALPVEVLLKSQALGATGAIVGSVSWGDYLKLKEKNFPVLVFGGFGSLPCPRGVYAMLKSLTGHLVIASGERTELLYPNPPTSFKKMAAKEKAGRWGDRIAELRVGDELMVLGDNLKPFWAQVGKSTDERDLLLTGDVACKNPPIGNIRLERVP